MNKIKMAHKTKDVADSFFGAKLFYFSITFGIIITTIIYDKNVLMLDLKNLEFFFPLTFFSFIIVSCYLFITTGNNPGYFNLDNAENSDTSIITINKNNENNHINSTINKDEELNKHDQYTITQQNIDENLNDPFKFCNKCKIEKFLRMRHCEKCERCVHKFDHHCFWIGACVGELNHARFWIFLFFQTIVNLMGFVISFDALDNYEYYTTVVENNKVVKIYSTEYGTFFICAVVAFFFTIFTSILVGYHTYLILTNQTTWEHNKRDRISYIKDFPKNVYPFSEGVIKNIKMVFFTNNQIRVWKTKDVELLKEEEHGFNYCDNQYYSCC